MWRGGRWRVVYGLWMVASGDLTIYISGSFVYNRFMIVEVNVGIRRLV